MHKALLGKLAVRDGAFFEDWIRVACANSSITCVRIPDGCKQISGSRIIRVKSPFDFILAMSGKSAAIDAKLRNEDHLTPASFANKDSTREQLKHLLNLQLAGMQAGFLVYLRPINEIHYYDALTVGAAVRGKTIEPKTRWQYGPAQRANLAAIWAV